MSGTHLTIVPVVGAEVFAARLAELERWLWERGYGSLGLGRLPSAARLADGVAALSDLYTVNRTAHMGAAADRKHLPAKILYFLISDAPKIAFILRELAERYGPQGRLPTGEAENLPRRLLRVADLGAGVGATSAGLLLSLDANQTPQVHLEGIDADAEALRLWREVTLEAGRIAGVRVDLRTTVRDLGASTAATALERTDLFVVQAVLNELDFAVQPPVLPPLPVPLPPSASEPLDVRQATADSHRATWIGHWARQAMTIIIEPALHDPTRALQRARDLLLAAGGVRVLAPCPHQQPCPMLQRQRDWCHEVRLWGPTPKVALVQAMTRRRDERTKFAFLALAPESGSDQGGRGSCRAVAFAASAPPEEGGSPNAPTEGQMSGHLTGRLVSDALNSKGKMERWICSGNGQLVQLRLLDRQRTSGNELLATAERGTLVDIRRATVLPRITEEATVQTAPAMGPP